MNFSVVCLFIKVLVMILFLGAIPPPLGGVSVYCLRRIESLKKYNVDYIFYDSRKRLSLVKLIVQAFFMVFRKKKFTIELNVSNPVVLFVFIILRLNQFTIFVDHNGSRRLVSNVIKKKLFYYFQNDLKAIKIVNTTLQGNYSEKVAEKIELISPFLPPTEKEMSESVTNFPSEYAYLLSLESRKIILTTAWKPINTNNEPDLYGLLDSMNVYSKLIPFHSEFFFVLMIGQLGNDDFSKKIKIKIEELSIFNNFIFITSGVSQLPILTKTKILLRLTKTDGDSVSVREAIYYGSNVIASNVTNRPDNVIQVENGNLNSVLKIINDLLRDLK